MPSSAPIVNILNWFLWLGSAFVQFIDPASVQHCLQTSGESLLFNGRMLDVTLALSPRELSAIKECGEEKSDKRNLYLSKEGSKQTHTHTHTHTLSLSLPRWPSLLDVQSGSEAAQGLSKTELAKRLKVCSILKYTDRLLGNTERLQEYTEITNFHVLLTGTG